MTDQAPPLSCPARGWTCTPSTWSLRLLPDDCCPYEHDPTQERRGSQGVCQGASAMGRSLCVASRNPTVPEPQHRVIRTCHIEIFIIAVRFRSPGVIPAPDLSHLSLRFHAFSRSVLLSLLGFWLAETDLPKSGGSKLPCLSDIRQRTA